MFEIFFVCFQFIALSVVLQPLCVLTLRDILVATAEMVEFVAKATMSIACMYYFITFSEQVIASIVDDSRCGMSNIAFRTAPPIGGLSCWKRDDQKLSSLWAVAHWSRFSDIINRRNFEDVIAWKIICFILCTACQQKNLLHDINKKPTNWWG